MKATTVTVAHDKKEMSLITELPDQILGTEDYKKS